MSQEHIIMRMLGHHDRFSSTQTLQEARIQHDTNTKNHAHAYRFGIIRS